MSLSDDKQANVIDAFNTTSRYLDDILNINDAYFDIMVSQIYPSDLRDSDFEILNFPFLDGDVPRSTVHHMESISLNPLVLLDHVAMLLANKENVLV